MKPFILLYYWKVYFFLLCELSVFLTLCFYVYFMVCVYTKSRQNIAEININRYNKM